MRDCVSETTSQSFRLTPIFAVIFSYYSAPLELRSIVISLTVHLSVCSDNSKPVRPNFTKFLCMLLVAVDRFSSDGVAIRYVLPVLRMTSCFPTMGPIGGRTGTALCTSSPVAAGGAQVAMGRLAR